MNRYLDFFLIAFVVFGAAALIYNIHKYGLDPTLAAIKKALGLAETKVVSEAETAYATAKTDLATILTRIETLFGQHATTVNTAAATIKAAVATATAAAVPVAAPVGVPTCNGVPVPPGMTLTSFTQLVVAKQIVIGWLASATMLAAIAAGTAVWFESLGPYVLQQLSAMTPLATPAGVAVAAYVTQHPVPEVVTTLQDAAAAQAVNAVVPPPVA